MVSLSYRERGGDGLGGGGINAVVT